MLFELVTGVVGKLSIRGQRDILLSQSTLHRHNPLPHIASKGVLARSFFEPLFLIDTVQQHCYYGG
jgi:hypothetical protein